MMFYGDTSVTSASISAAGTSVDQQYFASINSDDVNNKSPNGVKSQKLPSRFDDSIPPLNGQRREVFDVVAPATLPPGFKFRAQSLDGRTFTATVPPEGIAAGDSFTVLPMPDEVYPSKSNAPVWHW
eukprot:CAMPEP_0113297404 /NCGR_PEP_ID=MMETSP0010_2-20120614/283_1 /TAXON_ID=216773 ORGANISM="Corethron hystrix, Strain 308" /NCGR_SAMPLE_ID=MMETSP0010_2 /ASSEMBLY_ACC=CAM_ASM_000155 /LENGTH=126 /DNA_ID=CAMNT_0000150293 /DNA_START=79 /DNA_END=456 /DNA_ORIENTATION=- /assembly_acc=CAM_ASM_000155